MSRKAKIIIRIVCLIVLAITIVLLVKHYNKVQEQREHEKLMQQSIEEINYINRNSDMYGLKLLTRSAFVQGKRIINGQKRVGNYNSQLFNEEMRITHICIESSGGNILGMKVGDQYDKTSTFLESEGYILCDEGEGVPSDRKKYIFEKAYVTVGIQVFPDNVIECIWVAISDPTMPVIVS